MIVTRFAPSPTGLLHLGHAYSALFGWHKTRDGAGRFLLRIEDIDPARCRPEFEAAILADLAWLGIDTVVLGCTHYPFVADRIAARLAPNISLLDTADAVARRVVDLLPARTDKSVNEAPLVLQTTGKPELLARMALIGLGRDVPVQHIEL